ncbi:MAG TPA: hypothetical protein DD729_04415 [Rhodobacteraceae bacterium]|jgi:hypothetical protein|nr:hypothetical protein [Paracoccaceae bacterium]
MGDGAPNGPVVLLFSRIYMRADKDPRRDDIVKQEMPDRLLATGKQIAFDVDDCQQVVDMWRRNGITCLQCDAGNFLKPRERLQNKMGSLNAP